VWSRSGVVRGVESPPAYVDRMARSMGSGERLSVPRGDGRQRRVWDRRTGGKVWRRFVRMHPHTERCALIVNVTKVFVEGEKDVERLMTEAGIARYACCMVIL
jgi:hypothetical protein